MKKPIMMIALAIWLAPFMILTSTDAQAAGGAFAQDPASKKKEEADAYKAWYDANAARDIPKAIELAKAYLEKFPEGEYAKYLRDTWLPSTRPYLFNQAMQAKNIAEMIRIGKEVLARDPDNLDYLYLLALNIRTNELFASPPNFSHAADAADFSLRAIKLIEADKVPNVVPKDKWNKEATLAWLYQNLAVIAANNKETDKAIEYYKKASQHDPANAFNFLACGSLHQAKYQAAAQKFQSLPEADRQSATEPNGKPEAKAALEEVNRQADAVIDCWARFMALTVTSNPFGATRSNVEKALTELYKYRHPDSPDGLQKLIDHYRSTSTSSHNTGTASTRP
jgi:tetratricopeptide (TPR) repeat protein